MIDKKIYDLDYIRELQARYKTDPGLLERVSTLRWPGAKWFAT